MKISDKEIRSYADVYIDYDYPWEPAEIEADLGDGYNRGEDPFLSGLDPADLDQFIQEVIKETDRVMKGYFNAR